MEEFCCICVKKYPHLENINKTDDKDVKYSYKLVVCAPNQIWSDDYNICENCIERLNTAFEFVQICLKSEGLRQEQLRILNESSEIKKEIVEFEKVEIKLEIGSIPFEDIKIEIDENFIPDNPIIKEDCRNECFNDNSENDDNLENIENASYYSSNKDIKPQDVKKKRNKRKNPLTCECCGKVFRRKQQYSSHIRSQHTFEKPYKCNLCDARYSNSQSLLVHKRNHNNEKPFICSYCGKSFVCSGALHHHIKIHLNKREYKCSLCDKSFNTTSSLRTHKICMHTDPEDWKYICSYCNKRFAISSGLASHIKRHTGIKEFTCHVCEKKFYNKCNLTKHLKSHSSERSYKCNLCQGKEYKDSYGLRKHMLIVHDIDNKKITKMEK